MPVDLDLFRRSMQRLAAAVTVVAAGSGTTRTGFTASAVSSLTAEPPTLLVCVNREGGSYRTLVEEARFSVNVLAHDQADVAQAFAGLTGLEGIDRFATGEWTEGESGLPVLAGGLVGFECSLEVLYPRSSHDIIVGRIEHVHLPDRAVEPLLYLDRRFGSFAG